MSHDLRYKTDHVKYLIEIVIKAMENPQLIHQCTILYIISIHVNTLMHHYWWC